MESNTTKLNSLIRDLAVRGQVDDECYDYMMDTTVNWKAAGQYLAVYLETCYYTYGFRVFKCRGNAAYDRKLVLDPSYDDEDYRCLFDYSIDMDGNGELKHFAEGDWCADFNKAAVETFEEAADNRIFLATPISGFATENEYLAFKEKAIGLIAFLRSKGFEVYSEMERIDSADDYDSPGQSVEEDFEGILRSDIFILLHPARMQTSTLIEFGYACANNKKIIAVGSKNDLPYFVIGYAEYSAGAKIVETEVIDERCFEAIAEALE